MNTPLFLAFVSVIVLCIVLFFLLFEHENNVILQLPLLFPFLIGCYGVYTSYKLPPIDGGSYDSHRQIALSKILTFLEDHKNNKTYDIEESTEMVTDLYRYLDTYKGIMFDDEIIIKGYDIVSFTNYLYNLQVSDDAISIKKEVIDLIEDDEKEGSGVNKKKANKIKLKNIIEKMKSGKGIKEDEFEFLATQIIKRKHENIGIDKDTYYYIIDNYDEDFGDYKETIIKGLKEMRNKGLTSILMRK